MTEKKLLSIGVAALAIGVLGIFLLFFVTNTDTPSIYQDRVIVTENKVVKINDSTFYRYRKMIIEKQEYKGQWTYKSDSSSFEKITNKSNEIDLEFFNTK